MHLQEGIALECSHLEYSQDLDAWLAELAESGLVIRVEAERVREQDPITREPGEGPVVADADPSDVTPQLLDAATELFLEFSAQLEGSGSLILHTLENDTAKRIPRDLIEDAATQALGSRVITGDRRDAVRGALRLAGSTRGVPQNVREIAEFYGVTYILFSQLTSETAPAPDGSLGRHFTLGAEAFGVQDGGSTWKGSRIWEARW